MGSKLVKRHIVLLTISALFSSSLLIYYGTRSGNEWAIFARLFEVCSIIYVLAGSEPQDEKDN